MGAWHLRLRLGCHGGQQWLSEWWGRPIMTLTAWGFLHVTLTVAGHEHMRITLPKETELGAPAAVRQPNRENNAHSRTQPTSHQPSCLSRQVADIIQHHLERGGQDDNGKRKGYVPLEEHPGGCLGAAAAEGT